MAVKTKIINFDRSITWTDLSDHDYTVRDRATMLTRSLTRGMGHIPNEMDRKFAALAKAKVVDMSSTPTKEVMDKIRSEKSMLNLRTVLVWEDVVLRPKSKLHDFMSSPTEPQNIDGIILSGILMDWEGRYGHEQIIEVDLRHGAIRFGRPDAPRIEAIRSVV